MNKAKSSSNAGHRKRLKARVKKHGAETLADYELLEMLLFQLIFRRDTKQIAKQYIDDFGSLNALLQASEQDLQNYGLNEKTIKALKLPSLSARALIETEKSSDIIFNSSKALRHYIKDNIPHSEEKQIRILYLDGRNSLLEQGFIKENERIANQHMFIVYKALQYHATAIIIIHYNPQYPGVTLAQEARGLAHSLKHLSIIVHDVILVGKGWMTSLREERLLT